MRITKFRGRKVETVWKKKYTDYIEQAGEFVYGSLVDLGDKDIYIVNPNEYSEDRTYNAAYKEAEYVKVYRETVGQYTGLKDKNGKDIYEGDVSEGEHATYLIQWNAEKAQYQAKIIKTKSVLSKHCSFPLWQYVEDDGKCRFEVIGNIHENKELLEVVPND